MTVARLRRVLFSLLGISVALTVAAVLLALHIATSHPGVPLYDYLREGTIGAIAELTLATILVLKVPRHTVTWAFVASSLLGSIQQATGGYAVEALRGHSGELPLGLLALNVSAIAQLWFVFAFLLAVFLFPTGRPRSRAWWFVLWAYLALIVIEVPQLLSTSHALRSATFPPLLDLELPGWVQGAQWVFGVLAVGGTVAHVIVRFLRSKGLERQQLKWFAFAFVFGVAILLTPWTENDLVGSLLWTLVPVGILTSIAIAILRYRLYEIDRIVSRTVSYAVIALVLAGVYASGVLAVQTLLPASGDVAVAASTLVAAALFNPVRRRVQNWVDRRFNRSKYDAAEIVETFSARLRDAVDLSVVTRDLGAVLEKTVAPVTATVWVRGEAAG